MNEMQRLRYEITDWSQVTECKSNNSKDFSMRYIEIDDEDIIGKLVMVEHAIYGTLFSFLVDARGALLSSPDPMGIEPIHTLRLEEIVAELHKFGFDIYFRKEKKLTGEQLEYLMNLGNLGFEKIRAIDIVMPYVPHQPKYRRVIVGFMVGNLPKWLDNTYQCPESEFHKAIEDGSAVNLTAISKSKHFDWSFLGDFVLSINDILAVHA